MAENDQERSGEDLSEEASPYRLEEYRRKGMVAQSKELTALAALLAAAGMAYAMAPGMAAQLAELMRELFRTDVISHADFNQGHFLGDQLMKALKIMAAVGLPICLAGFVIGIISSFVQIGSVFSFDPLTPDASRLDPLKGIQRIFSLKHLWESLLMIGKAAVVLAISYYAVKTKVLDSPRFLATDPESLFSAFGETGKRIFLPLFGAMTIFGAGDYFLGRREFNKNVRLTKQEAKQEYKEREGDPQIKARIRAVQREVARRRMMQAVRKADVIVTNPTHIAVAIVYDKDKMLAPKVVAKGADFLAQRIKKVAADAGVPMVENVPLARTLYKTVKIGQTIPRVLYQAVAEVLAYVYRLKGRH